MTAGTRACYAQHLRPLRLLVPSSWTQVPGTWSVWSGPQAAPQPQTASPSPHPSCPRMPLGTCHLSYLSLKEEPFLGCPSHAAGSLTPVVPSLQGSSCLSHSGCRSHITSCPWDFNGCPCASISWVCFSDSFLGGLRQVAARVTLCSVMLGHGADLTRAGSAPSPRCNLDTHHLIRDSQN